MACLHNHNLALCTFELVLACNSLYLAPPHLHAWPLQDPLVVTGDNATCGDYLGYHNATSVPFYCGDGYVPKIGANDTMLPELTNGTYVQQLCCVAEVRGMQMACAFPHCDTALDDAHVTNLHCADVSSHVVIALQGNAFWLQTL